MKTRIFIALIYLISFATSSLPGQTTRGTITGRVMDASGGVMPGVEVTAINVATDVKAIAFTNDEGYYVIPNLPWGQYTVTFSASGFKTTKREGINVAVAQVVKLDVVMELGEISEQVTVTADAPLLSSEAPDVGTNITSKVVTDLPLSIAGGRAIEKFAYALTPSVEGNNWTSYIAGGQEFTKEVLIDGITAVSQIGGHIGESSPTMEAVQEFKVQTSGMSAEYGRTGGGVFNFTLKSGTNELHGSAFTYLHNEILNANTWQNNWRLSQNPDDQFAKRPLDRQKIYGFSAGGPIKVPGVYDGRGKTFLFGAFEKYTQERLVLGPMNQTVPIPPFLDGDFSALLDTRTVLGKDALGRDVYSGQIFDPLTLRQVGNVWVADPFPGNVIPQNRISRVSRQIADIFRTSYKPMIPGRLTNNSALPRHNDPWFHQTQLTFKADHNISDRNKLSGSFIWTERPRILVDAGGIWDPADPDKTGGPLSRARKQEVTSRSLRLSHDYSFSSHLINTIRFAYNRYRNPSKASSAKGNWPQRLGFGSVTSAGHFPDITFGPAVNGVAITRIGYSSSGEYISNNYIINDGLTWIKGRHVMKFGGEIRFMQFNSHSPKDAVLSFSFSPLNTAIPNQPWSNRMGFGFASFMLGAVERASLGVPFDLYGRKKYYAAFVQDDWKVSPRLTLNLGLRWEATGPHTEKFDRWANFDPKAVNPKLGIPGALTFVGFGEGRIGANSFERKRDWREFGPRFGFAYQLSNRAVIRGAYGIFYSPIGMQHWFGVPYGFAPGFQGRNEVLRTGNLPAFYWDNGYPGVFQPGVLDPSFVPWGPVYIHDRSLFAPRIQQWNIGAQFELTRDMVFEASYLGNIGRRLHDGDLIRNQPAAEAWERLAMSGKALAWVSDPASAAAAGVPYPYPGFSGYAGFAITPFPHVAAQFGPLFGFDAPLGKSDYNALQLMLNKRMSKGLASYVSYVLSRARGNTGGYQESWSFYPQGDIQDIHKLDEEAKTPLHYDRRHIFKGTVAWELPFGRGRRFLSSLPLWADAILGGWTVSTIFRYQSGAPLGIRSSNVYFWYGWDGPVYADVSPNASFDRKFKKSNFNAGKPDDPGNLYFDPSSFSNPPFGKLGNGKRLYNNLRGFGGAFEDLGIMKYINFGERFRLQLRAEFLNIFNRHYFQNPGTDLGDKTTFGYVFTTTGAPREGQIGIRFEW